MAFNLKNRSLLTLRDYTPREISFLIKLAADLKTAKYTGTEVPKLQGKDIALIFEKDSTRTRVGFEVAAYDQVEAALHTGRLAHVYTWCHSDAHAARTDGPPNYGNGGHEKKEKSHCPHKITKLQ